MSPFPTENIFDGEPAGLRRDRSITQVLGFTDAGLLLGAGTCLVRMKADGRSLALDGDRNRLLALLSVAAARPASLNILRPVEAAANDWQRGDKALANLRLALARLPRIATSADADRLCLAEHLLDNGMAPAALMKALDFEPAELEIEKYAYDQPRVPAGHGRESGRWTEGDGGIVVAIDDSIPGAKKPFGDELPGELDPAKEHSHYIRINPLQGTGLPAGIGPGYFARYGVRAGPGSRPSPTQKNQVQELGRAFGCHTCGTRDPGTTSGRFFCDHQRPTSLCDKGEEQVYLPHCRRCSASQGGLIKDYKQ